MAEKKAPIYYDDLAVGDELPPVERPPMTYTWLVTYCGVAGVFDPIHFDMEAAHKAGFDELIANGSLRVAFLSECVANAAYPEGDLLRLTAQHRAPLLRNDPSTTRALVMRKYVDDGKGYLECELWTETPRAGRTDIGTALIRLPMKAA